MSYAAIIVEFSPTTAPLATPSWVDITAYVMGSVSITRGRGSEFDTFGAGSAQLVLNNDDRRFDPSYASGPYYGNLKAKRRIRVRTSGYTLFTGWVEGWPNSQDWELQRNYVELTATDALGQLSMLDFEESPYNATVLSDSPRAFMPLDGSTRVWTSTAGWSPISGHAVTGVKQGLGRWIASEEAVGYELDMIGIHQSGLQWPSNLGNTDASSYVLGFIPSGGNRRTVEWWMKCDPATYARNGVFYAGGYTYDVLASGQIRHQQALQTSSGSVADGRWHHVVWTQSGSTSLKVYIDGVLDSTFAVATNVCISDTDTIGSRMAPYGGVSPAPGYGWDGAVKCLAVYDAALSAAEVLDHFEAALGWVDETTGTRVGRYLDMVGWPTADRTVDGGVAIVPRQGPMSGSVLDQINTVTTAEGGRFFGAVDGTVVYRNRYAHAEVAAYNSTQATFGVSSTDIRYEDVQVALDMQFVRNRVFASRVEGREFQYQDTSSVTDYFPRSDSSLSDLYLKSDCDVQSLAEWMILKYAEPSARVESLVVNGRFSSAASTAVQSLDLLHRIVVKVMHTSVGAAVTHTLTIESITHDINLADLSWRTTYTTSPADTSAYFTIGSSALGGSAVLAL